MPATIEIKDEERGNIFLNFVDIESTVPIRNFSRRIL